MNKYIMKFNKNTLKKLDKNSVCLLSIRQINLRYIYKRSKNFQIYLKVKKFVHMTVLYRLMLNAKLQNIKTFFTAILLIEKVNK